MRKAAAAAGIACFVAASLPYCALGAQTGEQLQQQDALSYSIPGEWTGDDMDSRYRLEDGTFLEKSWLFRNGRWYYLDQDGYPAAGWNKIKGKWYYFNEDTGRMAVGWTYSHENDEWYYLNEDGTRKTGWLETDGIWYWLDSDGVLYDDGWRMVEGHKYYFHSNGQLAAGQYIGTAYYGADGLRNPDYDMKIQGKRKPSDQEKEAITKALENIPRRWIERFLADEWEFMYYTDRRYMEAPMTDGGVFYVYHKTDPHYKKIKFTDPQSLTRAFGEYAAGVIEANPEQRKQAEELYAVAREISSGTGFSEYFEDDYEAWFGVLFECYCDPDIRSEMQMLEPELCKALDELLETDFAGLRPSVWEMTEGGEAGAGGAFGPALDPALNPSLKRQTE